ncbi:MAG: hypothetical protein ACOVT5_08900, partial [Armatimonadaceae bacterium]
MTADQPAPETPRGRVDDLQPRAILIALTAWAGAVVLFVGFTSDWHFWLSVIAAGYLWSLAFRARRLCGPKIRRAWRNLVLMVVLSVVGVVLVQATAPV